MPLEQEGYGQTDVYVPLDRQNAYSTIVYMTKDPSINPHLEESKEGEGEGDNDDFVEHGNYYHTLELKAILLELYDNKKKEDDILIEEDSDEEIDYELDFDPHFDSKTGYTNYKCRLLPGKYMLTAKGKDIKEFSKIISITDQITVLTLQPESKLMKGLMMCTYDATTGSKLSNVLIKLRKAHSKIVTQGLSRDGYCGFTIDQN